MLTLYISASGMSAVRLDLPMSLDEMKRQMEIVRTKEQSNRPVLIYGTESQIPILRYHLQSVCQRQFEIVRKRRRNFVVFRRGCG